MDRARPGDPRRDRPGDRLCARTEVPEPNEIATAQTSIVYYADGKTEMGRLSDSEGNRACRCRCPRSPDHMQKAILAGEDQSFYQNNGISPTGIARAVWVAVKGGAATRVVPPSPSST